MKEKGETTIHDIARKLNISASTVSRALNNNPLISKKTSDLIKKTAQQMGYRPNTVAANFRTKKTNTIGVIVPLINRHFFSSVISGIEDIAYKSGFTVTISQSNDSLSKEKHIAQAMFNNRVDGVILSIGMESIDTSHLNVFSEKNIPLVFFDRVVDEIEADKIVVDDIGGGYIATKHLINKGYKKIAHIGGPLNLKIYQNREKGYNKALAESQLSTNSSWVIHNTLTKNDGILAVNKLLACSDQPDAIFCANDTTALSVITQLKKLGFKIPQQMAVVGFSNEPFSEVVTPSISTIKQPGFQMGQKAAKLLLDRLQSKNIKIPYQTIVMPTELIIREST